MKLRDRIALLGVVTATAVVVACAPFQEPKASHSRGGWWLYKRGCAACHGMTGEGNPPVGPRLRGSSFVRERSVDELKDVIRSGRAGQGKRFAQFLHARDGFGDMPAFSAAALSDDQLDTLAAWLKSGMRSR